MISTLLLVAALAQTPEVTAPSREAGWKYLHKHVVIGAGGELGLGSWAGPLSPSPNGPSSSAPGLLVGLDWEPVDSPAWIQRHTSASLLLDGARWSNGDFTMGLAFSSRFLLFDGAVSPFAGYELGVRYLSIRALTPGSSFGLDLVPDVGVQANVGTSIVRLEAGPHFFASFRAAPDQWWRTRVTITVPF